MRAEYAKFLLKKTVTDYNRIAGPFSKTRVFPSPELLALKKYSVGAKTILDLGCGNGRLSELFDEDQSYVGGDDSSALIKIAKERYPDKSFEVFDPLLIPYPDKHFDVVYCLAVFHHIPSTELRIQYLHEIGRVMAEGGTLVMTVWNMWKKPGMIWRIIRSGLFHPSLDLSDTFYPFKDEHGRVLAERYIHCFKEEELERLFMASGFKVKEFAELRWGKHEENSNILVIGRR